MNVEQQIPRRACVSASICMGGPVTKSLFYNGGNRAISSKRAKLSTVGPHNFVSLKFLSFSLFLKAFEVLPISLASSVIHVSCKDRSVIVVVSGLHLNRWSCLLFYKLVCS